MQLIAVRVQRAQRETTRSHSLEQALTCAAARDEFGKVGVRRLGPVPGRDLDRVQAKFDGQAQGLGEGKVPDGIGDQSKLHSGSSIVIDPSAWWSRYSDPERHNTTDNTTKAPRESQSGDAVVTPGEGVLCLIPWISTRHSP